MEGQTKNELINLILKAQVALNDILDYVLILFDDEVEADED